MAKTDLHNAEPQFSITILDHYSKLGGVPPRPSRIYEPDLYVTELALPPHGLDGHAVLHYQVTGPLLSIQKYTERWYRTFRIKLQWVATPNQWEDQQDDLFAELQMLAQLCYASQANLDGPPPQSLIDAVELRFGQ